MKLIVGLGNPGKEYENTRHNIGFMALDNYIASAAWKKSSTNQINSNAVKDIINNYDNMANWQKKFKGLYTCITINNEKVYFLKPGTYMNLSGESVRELVNFFKINPEDILVIHDDLDLDLGRIRIKQNSSDGGHNGIKSIISNLGTKNFVRLKVGISHNKKYDTKDYVLGHFNKEEQDILTKNYLIINNIINDFILNTDIYKLMNTYNGDLNNWHNKNNNN